MASQTPTVLSLKKVYSARLITEKKIKKKPDYFNNWFNNYEREKKLFETQFLSFHLFFFFFKALFFRGILFILLLLERPANQNACVGPGPGSVLSSKCDSSPDRGIIGNRWLTLLICGLKLQTEFQESSRVINGNRKSHTQPNQYVVVVG